MNPQDYDYTVSGFDGFLSRSIDSISMTNLDSAGPRSNQMAFDRNLVSGSLGDTLRIGKIYLNGSDGNIIMNDGGNDVLLIGNDTSS